MKRILLHFPVGLINVLAVWASPHLGYILALAFTLYELNEDWHIKNGAWKDIAGWVLGLEVGAIIWAWVKV